MASQDKEAAGAEERPARERLGFVERVGAALVAPRWALAAAERDPGRTSGDAVLLLLCYFAAVHTDLLVSAGWLLLEGHLGAGLQSLVSELARTITAPLVFLFGSGVLLTLLAGRRRSVGTDFDLACVALVPLVSVHAAAWLLMRVAGGWRSGWIHDGVNVIGYGWASIILALGLWQARARAKRAPGEEEAS